MASGDALLSYVVDSLTTEIESANAAGNYRRARGLRTAREQVLAVLPGSPRRWWHTVLGR